MDALFDQAMFSSVLPGDIMEGHLTCQINFPAWLGKNSRRSKFQRILQELHGHMRLRYALFQSSCSFIDAAFNGLYNFSNHCVCQILCIYCVKCVGSSRSAVQKIKMLILINNIAN
jgi:hypothetical protein